MGVHEEGNSGEVYPSAPGEDVGNGAAYPEDVSLHMPDMDVPVETTPDVIAPPSLPPGANRPGWLELASVLGIVWATELVVGVLVAIISISRNGLPSGADGLDLEPWAIIATMPFSAGATIIACWYFACRRQGRTFRDGLYAGPVAAETIRRSVALGFVCAVVGGALMMYFSTGGSALESLLLRPSAEDPEKVTLFYPILVLFLLVPVLEELYYRGFLFSVLERLLGTGWSFAIVVAWFGLIHAPQLAGDLAGLPVVTAMGAVFTWLRYRYGSILPGIICHCTYNGVLVAVTVIQVQVQHL